VGLEKAIFDTMADDILEEFRKTVIAKPRRVEELKRWIAKASPTNDIDLVFRAVSKLVVNELIATFGGDRFRAKVIEEDMELEERIDIIYADDFFQFIEVWASRDFVNKVDGLVREEPELFYKFDTRVEIEIKYNGVLLWFYPGVRGAIVDWLLVWGPRLYSEAYEKGILSETIDDVFLEARNIIEEFLGVFR
jgi:hypothetical protein